MNSLQKAIDLLGGLTSAGKQLGVTKGVIFQWRERGRVPAEYCPALEKLTGIRCEELNDKIDWAYLRNQLPPKSITPRQIPNASKVTS